MSAEKPSAEEWNAWKEVLKDALRRPEAYPDAAEAISRWANYSPVIREGDRWLPEGLIAYFKGMHEILVALGVAGAVHVTPPLP